MRHLMPVGDDETLIAQGTYTCSRVLPMMDEFLQEFGYTLIERIPIDGDDEMYYARVASGMVECWTIHRRADGARLIRCDRQADNADNGMQVQGVMGIAPSGQTEHMAMQVSVDETLAAEATYDFAPDQVHIRRRTLVARDTYGDWLDESMPLPSGYRVDFGRLTISKGLVLHDILRETGGGDSEGKGSPVFSPDNPGGYVLHFQPYLLLRGMVEHFALSKVESDVAYPVGDTTLVGDEYQLKMTFGSGGGFGYGVLMDRHGIMLRDGTDYEFHLTDYTRFDG